jgi:hypothetical protein
MLLKEPRDLVHVGCIALSHFQKHTIDAVNGGEIPETETLE